MTTTSKASRCGVWDSKQKRFITYRHETREAANEALAYWQFEYRADGEDDSVLSVREIQPSDDDLIVAPEGPARESGFVAPVLIARPVWDDCVVWTDDDHARTGALQDEDGRLWDVLYMAARAVRTMQRRYGDGWSEALFQVWRVARDRRPGEDGDIEATPVYLTAARTDDGITITNPQS